MANNRQNSFQKIWWLPLGCFLFLLGGFLVLVWQTHKPPERLQVEGIVTTSPSIAQGASADLPVLNSPASGLPMATATPVSISLSPTSTPTSLPVYSEGELAALQQLALQLVNETRQAYGLSPVMWDSFAAEVGQQHVLEMSANRYLSHWNLQGLGPNIRYSFASGTDVVQENVFNYWRFNNDNSPAPIDDLEAIVREAHEAWMNSAGHRANILNSAHTHLGIGLAYNPDTGYVSLAQEFTNHYIEMEAVPRTANLGDEIQISGTLLSGASNPLINLAYEPLPRPMSLQELEATSTYLSAAKIVDVPFATMLDQNRFEGTVRFDTPGTPGLYHIHIWVGVDGETIPAIDMIVRVEQ